MVLEHVSSRALVSLDRDCSCTEDCRVHPQQHFTNLTQDMFVFSVLKVMHNGSKRGLREQYHDMQKVSIGLFLGCLFLFSSHHLLKILQMPRGFHGLLLQLFMGFSLSLLKFTQIDR